MIKIYQADDFAQYRMDYFHPHRVLEPLEKEIAVVDAALKMLAEAGALDHATYSQEKMLAHRAAIQDLFKIPWTAISPRMQRLIYAINAIAQPQNMIAAGVFCGYTFISNAGAAVGPGACYTAKNLIGVEIILDEANRAERNVRRIDKSGIARVVADDAINVVSKFREPIHLLYLDADGDEFHGKGIYLDILQAGYDLMPPGALVLAHNSYSSRDQLKAYLEYVRNPDNFRASINVILDPEGLEVSVK